MYFGTKSSCLEFLPLFLNLVPFLRHVDLYIHELDQDSTFQKFRMALQKFLESKTASGTFDMFHSKLRF